MRFRDLIKKHKPLIFVVLETRVSSSRAKLVYSRISLRGRHIVEVEGFSGGIWIFWDSDIIQVSILKSHAQFIHARVKQGDESPNRQKRVELWDQLKEITEGVNWPWLLAGDFNSIVSMNEKSRGAPFDHNSAAPFRDAINDL
ncbi:Endonuclease/exonuclease/phosphatase [Gossypium australe]|uniref:Endonuclease/exonuclease/phosphatase n=1 Tax=Gossypium australe TaxID=47621 RepID=A0A5B6WP69_9ROSI|nr:Endonuclease/exonuclease/phosphatase [Gossypium australe]